MEGERDGGRERERDRGRRERGGGREREGENVCTYTFVKKSNML